MRWQRISIGTGFRASACPQLSGRRLDPKGEQKKGNSRGNPWATIGQEVKKLESMFDTEKIWQQAKTARLSFLKFRDHAFFSEFIERIGGLSQRAGTHAFEHMRCLGELHVIIGNDFNPIAPGVAKVQPLIEQLDI